MPIPALHATRALPFDADGGPMAPAIESDSGHPGAAPAEGAGARWRRRAPGYSFSLLFHAAAAGAFVYLWHHMVRDLSQPEGIPVEIVTHIPGEGRKPELPSPAPPAPAKPEPKPEPPATPAADLLKQALDLPSAPPDVPRPAPEATPPDARTLRGGLAEPPPEPKAAATQQDRNEKPNEATDAKPTPPAAPAPPPPAPEVLTVDKADTGVNAPAPPPPSPRTEKPNRSDPTSADGTARMAAALPLSSLGMPSTFRAMLSSQGSSESQAYKGVIYGSLSRARAAMQDEARRRRMKGQVVVLIAVTETGSIAGVSVIQSSGSAETDAFALDMVRRSGPFPPPPPGTSRNFTPAITFGDDGDP